MAQHLDMIKVAQVIERILQPGGARRMAELLVQKGITPEDVEKSIEMGKEQQGSNVEATVAPTIPQPSVPTPPVGRPGEVAPAASQPGILEAFGALQGVQQPGAQFAPAIAPQQGSAQFDPRILAQIIQLAPSKSFCCGDGIC